MFRCAKLLQENKIEQGRKRMMGNGRLVSQEADSEIETVVKGAQGGVRGASPYPP